MGRKLTIDEVCERLHITRNAWNQAVFRGDAPPRIRVTTRKFLVDEESLEQWLMSREEQRTA